MNKYDAIVVGGGHNGLVCAAYLAKAGKKVLVVEKRHVLGGAAVSEELYPGFTFSVASYVVSLFRPHIIRELNLAEHGYEVIPMDCTFTPSLDGDPGLARWSDASLTRREVSRLSRKDAEVYGEFAIAMTAISKFTKEVIDHPAPDITSYHPRELKNLMRLGQAVKKLGPEMMHLNTKLLTMSAVDFLSMWFESERLLAPMSVSGIIGTFQGVRSPGTAYVLLHHYMGELDGAYRSWGFSKGGTGGISMACARAAESFGAEIRTEAGVAEIKMKNGRAVGVVLENGDEIEAKIVVSNADPNRTMLGMVGEDNLPDDYVTGLKRFKYRGSSGKVNLALDGLPDFACRPGFGGHLKGDITIAPSINYLERAYDDAKYGDFSKHPFIDCVIPTLTDPSLAPPGKHIMSCFVQYAPYHLKEGADTWPDRREEFGDTVVNTLAEYMPNLKSKILYRQVLTPWDIEKKFGLTEGNIFQGELSLEQLLFQRPVAGWSNYQTPIKDLWLCGSGTHPGGGIIGSGGELSAKTILRSGAV
ncbi:MAG: amine oxidase [Bacteroidetes bacterium]|nr:MAG: amine oxidase [Bacteroidota bacterium]